jgi:Zn-dependent protease
MSDSPLDTTRHNLHFRLLAFPVCVRPTFWLVHIAVAVVIASDDDILLKGGLHPVVVGVLTFACTAASIFLHELGHALAGRRFGADEEIELAFFGGFAGLDLEEASRRQRVTAILAGPLVTLLLTVVGGVGFIVMQPSREQLERILDERYAAAPDGPHAVPPVPPPPGWAALEHVFLVLFGVNAIVLLLNLIPYSGTDGEMLLDEVRGRRGGDEPDCERGPDGWKRGAG